jgi:hypothetical protein
LSEFRGGGTGKAYGYLKKNLCNTSKNEILKMIKVNESHIEFISFVMPKRVSYY